MVERFVTGAQLLSFLSDLPQIKTNFPSIPDKNKRTSEDYSVI